jgi:hypothetical protein
LLARLIELHQLIIPYCIYIALVIGGKEIRLRSDLSQKLVFLLRKRGKGNEKKYEKEIPHLSTEVTIIIPFGCSGIQVLSVRVFKY